jgi:hypothetical protein
LIIILCRFDGLRRKGGSKFPRGISLINPDFLSIFDDMFYRLPFPHALHLEQLLKKSPLIQAKDLEFRSSVRAELDLPRAWADFASGFKAYLKNRSPATAATIVYASFTDRNRSPTPPPGSGAVRGSDEGGEGDGEEEDEEEGDEEEKEGPHTPQHPMWHLGLLDLRMTRRA